MMAYPISLIGLSDSPRLAAYLRTGSGTFVNTFNLSTGAAPASVMARDVERDGRDGHRLRLARAAIP